MQERQVRPIPMKLNVANKSCIRRIGFRHMKSAPARNIIAILAIALTSILFTAIFTVASSVLHGFEMANFRQVGGYAHGVFRRLTAEQVEELKDDPLIRQYGIRHILGVAMEEPFIKSQVEISYKDAQQAAFSFIEPIEGGLPKEGTNEASPASDVLLPDSRVNEILDRLDIPCADGITGMYDMDVMFRSASHIEENLTTVLNNHAYEVANDATSSSIDQSSHYISIGVNWGYLGAQLYGTVDLFTAAALVLVLLIIIFTGYLIIYNVFQISVSNDIRFYGLLKTIGTTGRQMKRIVRMLNFLNTILTGILTRHREFAVLQSVGMTGRQLKEMLITEGILYAAVTIVLTFILIVATAPWHRLSPTGLLRVSP